MTKGLRFAALLVALTGASVVHARSGGPDGFGYTWRDSAEPGVTYSWDDISATGTDIMVDGDDENYGFQPMPFAFPYYGNAYTQVAVCSNGWVSFVDDVSTAYGNGPLPDGFGPIGNIAAFWDDLRGTTGVSRVLVGALPGRFVITWENQHDLGDEAAVNTFQVILYDNGTIKTQYQNLTGDRTSCTAGIESPDQLNGLTAWYDDPAGFPASNYAILYEPPVPVPGDVDCSAPIDLACGDRVTGDTRVQGVANQDAYLCTRGDYAGREVVYEMAFVLATNVRLVLESQSGDQDLLVLSGCDPNRCLTAPGNVAYLTNVTGTVTVVVDSSAANEGAYTLRVDCLPLTADVDCANAAGVACGDVIAGDLGTGQARQDAYGCVLDDYSGRENVYRLDLRNPTNVEFVLSELSGDPDLIVLGGCDPNGCQVVDSGSVLLNDVSGSIYFVVDSGPGDEGRYEVAVNCLSENLAFCGDGLIETDPWDDANGVWLVEGWLYHWSDTHDFALRVDGDPARTYSTGDFDCQDFGSATFGVRMPAGPAFVEWAGTEARVRTELYETNSGGCCGLMISMTMTNTDTVPHFFEYRAYHDTAFGTGDATGDCGDGSTIDGGPIEVGGVRYQSEVDLLALGADSCAGQLQMFSADHPDQLRSSFEMLPPNLPYAMEYLDWDDGGQPCTDWQGLAGGTDLSGCSDNSVLFIWRFPATGMLAPGESATARYRVGLRCAWPCDIPCEDPVMGPVTVQDAGPCQGGLIARWDAATFPGAGNGVYHVYRSTISAADAMSQPALTPAGGITALEYVDVGTVSTDDYYYVVVAESLDFPNCGTGPAVLGSTAWRGSAMAQDYADVDPPASDVGSALRATGHTDDTVDFKWNLAPLPALGEEYVILRSDDDPQGPFLLLDRTSSQSWTDPAAPPRFDPRHIWYYDVRFADSCDNMSDD